MLYAHVFYYLEDSLSKPLITCRDGHLIEIKKYAAWILPKEERRKGEDQGHEE